MAKKQRSDSGHIFQALQLPEDLEKGNVFVSLHGQNYVRVENFRGISCYSCAEIRLLTRKGVLSVLGRNLEIESYTKDEIEISGHIKSLFFPE